MSVRFFRFLGIWILVVCASAFGQTACGTSGGVTCTYVEASVTGGNIGISSPIFTATANALLLVDVEIGNTVTGSDVSAINDTGFGNSYIRLNGTWIHQSGFFGGVSHVFYFARTNPGTAQINVRINVSGGGFTNLVVAQFTGVGTLVADQQTAANGSSANPSIGISNSSSPDVVVANLLTNAGTQPTFSNMTQFAYGNVQSIFAWTTTSGTGSFTATTTGGTSATYTYSIASIGPPGAASLVRHRSQIF